MKYFVFSDVHSFYDELMTALKEKGFDINNKEHIVISCGDLFDRGDQSKECLDFIVDMLKKDRAICIRGNHEDLLEQVFIMNYFRSHDFHNGTTKTFDQLCNDSSPELSQAEIIANVNRNEDLNFYLTNCKDFYELEDNIFVHGWIPYVTDFRDGILEGVYRVNHNWRTCSSSAWDRARWVNGMKLWNEGIRIKGKTIWCGHWNSSWGHCYLHNDGVERMNRVETISILEDGTKWPYVRYDTFKDDGIVALDACTVLSHKVNVEVIEVI